MNFKHSFAKAWLHRMEHKILINDKDFFKIPPSIYKRFKIKPLVNYIIKGQDLVDEDMANEIQILSYMELRKRLGYAVYKIPVGKKGWLPKQQDILIIAKRKAGLSGELPDGTYRRRAIKIEWLPSQKLIRGVGDNFGTKEGIFDKGNITPWIRYDEVKRKAPSVNALYRYSSYQDITDAIVNKYMGVSKKGKEKLPIPELPFMITNDGYLLCMQKSKQLIPKILFVGKTRGGKSFGLNRFMGSVFYTFQDRVGLLNDSLDQFYDLSLPQNKQALQKNLRRVGNEPRHLPAINLYMSCPHLRMRYTEEHISQRLVISMKEFLHNIENMTEGVQKWNIKSSSKYIDESVIQAICKSRSTDEMREAIYDVFKEKYPQEKEFKKRLPMLDKWIAGIRKVFEDEFTDNLFVDEESTAAEWTLKRADGTTLTEHPFIVALEAGLVPVVNNHLAKEYPIAEKQMALLIRRLVRHQMHQINKKRMWVFIDELKDFLDKKSKTSDLYQALDYLFTQGAFNNIGFCGSVQEYSRLTNAMRNNSSHLFIFEMRSNEERKAIAKDYNLDKMKLDSIGELPKHNCLFTTREKVVLYDKDQRRKVVDGGLWQGKMIPPISIHKSAGE